MDSMQVELRHRIHVYVRFKTVNTQHSDLEQVHVSDLNIGIGLLNSWWALWVEWPRSIMEVGRRCDRVTGDSICPLLLALAIENPSVSGKLLTCSASQTL